MWPWKPYLLPWAPFKVDALGLVTLLGAEEVDASVGRLLRSRWLEYLPLLGAFVIAGDRYREKHTGFNLYNISEGIHTTDLAAWYTRWLRSIEPRKTRTYVIWSVIDPLSNPENGQEDTTKEAEEVLHRERFDNVIAVSISFVLTGFLIAGTLMSKDWYGLANAIAMTASTFVRWWTISANRQAIDRTVFKTAKRLREARKKAIARDPMVDPPEVLRKVKTLVIMSDSRCVTNIMPNDLIIPVFTSNPEPSHKDAYEFVRWIGWLAFAVHVVSIGMADLATQLYTVLLLVVPTVLYVKKVGCDDSEWWSKTTERVRKVVLLSKEGQPADLPESVSAELQHKFTCYLGRHLKAEVCEWPKTYDLHPGEEKRMDLYTYLCLNQQETESMDKWDLFPHRRKNTAKWWSDYDKNRDKLRPNLREGVALYRQPTGPDDLAEGRAITVNLDCDIQGLPKNILLTASIRQGTDGNYEVSDAKISDPSLASQQPAAGQMASAPGGASQTPVGASVDLDTFGPPPRSNTQGSGIIPGPRNSAFPASGALLVTGRQDATPANSSGMGAIP